MTEFASSDKNVNNCCVFWRQLYVTITVLSFYFMAGMGLGTPTVAVFQLRREANSTAAVTDQMASWIASIIPCAGAFLSLVLLAATHYVGRKKPMFFACVCSLTSFAVLYYSENALQVFLSQLLHGFTIGAATTVALMGLIEYPSVRYRGFFIAMKFATYSWGTWIANAIGAFFHYKYIGLFGIMCSIYILISILFIPESPYWLACQSKYEECAITYRWLNGSSVEINEELNALIRTHRDLNAVVKPKMSIRCHIKQNVKVLRDPENYKSFLLCIVVYSMFHLSGKSLCSMYAIEYLSKIFKGDSVIAMLLITDGFSVFGTYLGSFMSKILQKRKMLLASGTSCVAFLFTLSLYLYLIKLSIVSDNTYITIFLLIGYTLAACFGPLGAAMAIFGDLFPAKHRTLNTCLFCFLSHTSYGIFIKLGPFIFRTFHVHGALFIFGISLTVLIILTYKYIPETMNRTPEEIVKLLHSEKVDKTAERKLLYK